VTFAKAFAGTLVAFLATPDTWEYLDVKLKPFASQKTALLSPRVDAVGSPLVAAGPIAGSDRSRTSPGRSAAQTRAVVGSGPCPVGVHDPQDAADLLPAPPRASRRAVAGRWSTPECLLRVHCAGSRPGSPPAHWRPDTGTGRGEVERSGAAVLTAVLGSSQRCQAAMSARDVSPSCLPAPTLSGRRRLIALEAAPCMGFSRA
jgi:hypothetical protein